MIWRDLGELAGRRVEEDLELEASRMLAPVRVELERARLLAERRRDEALRHHYAQAYLYLDAAY